MPHPTTCLLNDCLLHNKQQGNPNFARHLLGLPELSASTAGQSDAALATLGRLMGLTIG